MPHRLSAYRTTRNRTDGFTLAELLVVVAIVAILVAIAVPVFTSALGNTEEATCSANRRSVKSLYTTTWLLDQNQNQKDLFDNCAKKLKEQNKNVLCPSYTGNELEYTARFTANGDVAIKCSIHGASDEDETLGWISSNPWSNQNDTDSRKAYADKTGIPEWPEVKGLDGDNNGPFYLQFKSYDRGSAGAFLYAGPSKSIENDNSWRASYICDNGGLIGTPGQWYQVPKNTGIATDKAGMEAILRANEGSKVNLVNGKFVKG